MTFETFEKAKELREDIENIKELENLFENLFVSRGNSLSVEWGSELKNTIKTYQIPERLRNQILDLISDFICDLENDFEEL